MSAITPGMGKAKKPLDSNKLGNLMVVKKMTLAMNRKITKRSNKS
jgi:hypothetical protein